MKVFAILDCVLVIEGLLAMGAGEAEPVEIDIDTGPNRLCGCIVFTRSLASITSR